MNVKRLLCISIVFTLGFINTSFATNYYVNSSSGSDSNTGRSTTAAWRTIQKAAGIMSSGDTCFVSPGNYAERISITRSGSSSAPIVFKAPQKGAVTKGFTIQASYVTIDGFEISETSKSGGDNAIGIYARGQYIRILNNYIHNTYMEGIYLGSGESDFSTGNCLVKGNRMIRCGMAGLHVNGVNNVIESNEISGTVQWSRTAPGIASGMDADGLRFFGSGHVFRKNHIHDILLSDAENGNDPHIDCIQSWGPASNIIFEQNDFSLGEYGVTGRKQIAMVSGSDNSTTQIKNITFRNNIIHDSYRGLNLYGSLGVNSPIDGLVIVNNTFAFINENPVELHDAPNARVFNNIFHTTRQASIDASTTSKNLQIGYNNYYNISNLSTTSHTGDLRKIDPKFVDAAARNFKLQATSPVIDKGTSISSLVMNDISGGARPAGAGYDMGAYEYGATGTVTPPTTGVESTLKVTGARLLSSTSLKITFSGKISSAEALVKSNYSISPYIQIKSITMASTQDAVILNTYRHRRGTSYSVTVSNVKDLAGNIILATANKASYQLSYYKTNSPEDLGMNPDVFELQQNFPNPFNPSTLISYNVPENGVVTLKIYDILGKEVAELVNEFKEKGAYQSEFNGSSLASGTYIYQLRINGNVKTMKMILAK